MNVCILKYSRVYLKFLKETVTLKSLSIMIEMLKYNIITLKGPLTVTILYFSILILHPKKTCI